VLQEVLQAERVESNRKHIQEWLTISTPKGR